MRQVKVKAKSNTFHHPLRYDLHGQLSNANILIKLYRVYGQHCQPYNAWVLIGKVWMFWKVWKHGQLFIRGKLYMERCGFMEYSECMENWWYIENCWCMDYCWIIEYCWCLEYWGYMENRGCMGADVDQWKDYATSLSIRTWLKITHLTWINLW